MGTPAQQINESTVLRQWREQMRGWLAEMGELAKEIATATHKSPFLGRKFLRNTREATDYHENHGVNAGVYAALIGRELDFAIQELHLLTLGCIVHDVGNVYVPPGVLDKPGALTLLETQLVKQHSQLGAELLRSLGCPEEIARIALEHHERMDGSGYPLGLESSVIHPFSRICSVTDAYDALTSYRPNEQPISGKFAIEMMKSLLGKFDTQFLEVLSKIEK